MVTFKGKPLTLVGRHIHLYEEAHHFTAVTKQLEEKDPIELFSKKTKILTSFVSLDTPVCDLQVKEFNQEALKLAKDVVIIPISKDLPFAEEKFCQTFSIKNIELFSDYKNSSFGMNYGLLIKELNLLARSVIIVDTNNTIRYIEIVPELTHPPDYQKAFLALEKIVKSPKEPKKGKIPKKCLPCGGKVFPLEIAKRDALFKELKNWTIQEEKKLCKEIKFSSYEDGKYFLDLIALMAMEQEHHPVLTLGYKTLKITLTTHAAGGLTENDFILAKMVDELQEGS